MNFIDYCFSVYLAHKSEPVVFNIRGDAEDIVDEIMTGQTVREIPDYDDYAVSYTFNPANILHIEYFEIDKVSPPSWDDIYK